MAYLMFPVSHSDISLMRVCKFMHVIEGEKCFTESVLHCSA